MRSTIIAGLFVVELAIIGEAVVAVQAGQSSTSRALTGPHLIEDGPHQTFAAGSRPMLNIDIGYADLTIVTGSTSQIDVALAASTTHAFFEETAPIVARADGDMVRVATTDRGSSSGDNRMVTVVVPPETQVTVTKAGDIKVSGLRGETTIATAGMGSVSVDDFVAPLLRVTSKGAVTLHQVIATHLFAKSTDDDIEGSALQIRDGSIESDDHVTLGFAPGSNLLVTAHSDSGKVIAEGGAVVTPGTSGDNDDSSTKNVTIGGGSGHLDVKADDDITLSEES